MSEDGKNNIDRLSNEISRLREQLQAEVALRRQNETLAAHCEQRFTSILQINPDAIVISRLANDVILDVNESFVRISGFSREETLGKTVPELDTWVVPQHRQWFLSQLRQTGECRDFETLFRTKDGRLLESIITGRLIEIDSQQCVMSITHDITDRKIAERALNESELRFRTVAEALPHIVWTADANGNVDYYNQRWVEFSGGVTETVGKWPLQSAVHTEDAERTDAAWQRSATSNEPYHIEHRLRRVDGTWRWAISRALPLRDGTGRIIKWFGTTTDIHDRKMAEEALRESREKYRDLVHGVGGIILRMDAEGRITFFNDFAEKFFGFSRSEILGKPALGTIVPLKEGGTGRDLAEMIRQIFREPEKYAYNENENICKNSRRRV